MPGGSSLAKLYDTLRPGDDRNVFVYLILSSYFYLFYDEVTYLAFRTDGIRDSCLPRCEVPVYGLCRLILFQTYMPKGYKDICSIE